MTNISLLVKSGGVVKYHSHVKKNHLHYFSGGVVRPTQPIAYKDRTTRGLLAIHRRFRDCDSGHHHSTHLTIPLINLLAQNNVRVVFCNEQHMPVTMLMDLDSNVLQSKHFRAQLEAGKPLRKQIWKQIVERKIQNQSLLLKKLGKGKDPLAVYHTNVKSGDTTNREGIAAKVYWQNMFGKRFVRDRIGPAPNNLLNYGYALLRSAVARGIMDAGLLPSVGVFHRNYYNSFPLADDLMEPYRPFVDELVREMFFHGEVEITQAVKRRMVEEHYERLSQDEISATAHSLVHVFEREGNIPNRSHSS